MIVLYKNAVSILASYKLCLRKICSKESAYEGSTYWSEHKCHNEPLHIEALHAVKESPEEQFSISFVQLGSSPFRLLNTYCLMSSRSTACNHCEILC